MVLISTRQLMHSARERAEPLVVAAMVKIKSCTAFGQSSQTFVTRARA